MISPTPRAGTPQYCHALATALCARGHQVMLVTSLEYEFAARQPAYDVLEVFDRFRPRPAAILDFLRRLRAFDPDIVHFVGAQHPRTYLALSRFLRPFTGAAYVFSPLDVYSNAEAASERQVFTRLYARMRHVFADTARQGTMTQEHFAVPAANVSVFPMPDLADGLHEITPAELPDIPAGAPLVLCFGLIQPRKGIDVLIEAFAEVARAAPTAHLAIVGRAHTELQPYRDRIAALGLGERITLRGDYVPFEDMAAYFERATVVALPYLVGWTSGALATAHGYGKPVVTSDVDAMTEVVRDGENGLVAPAGDAAALASALIRVLTDPGLHARLSEGAARTARRISWAEKARHTEAAYLGAIG